MNYKSLIIQLASKESDEDKLEAWREKKHKWMQLYNMNEMEAEQQNEELGQIEEDAESRLDWEKGKHSGEVRPEDEY